MEAASLAPSKTGSQEERQEYLDSLGLWNLESLEEPHNYIILFLFKLAERQRSGLDRLKCVYSLSPVMLKISL